MSSTFLPLDIAPVAASTCSSVSDLVLQPQENLDPTQWLMFEQVLIDALHRVEGAVIVDLIWLTGLDVNGMTVLRKGIKLAAQLSKRLLLKGVTAEVYAEFDREWQNQRSLVLGEWVTECQPEFGQFLVKGGQTRTAPQIKSTLLKPKPFQKPSPLRSPTPIQSHFYTEPGWHAHQHAS